MMMTLDDYDHDDVDEDMFMIIKIFKQPDNNYFGDYDRIILYFYYT